MPTSAERHRGELSIHARQLLFLDDAVHSQRVLADLIGRRREWVNRYLNSLAHGAEPRMERSTENVVRDVYYVFMRARDVFADNAAEWLLLRQRLLRDKTPAQAIQAGETEKVLAVLDREVEATASLLRRSDLDAPAALVKADVGRPAGPAPTFAELDAAFDGKRLKIEEAIVAGRR